MWRADLAVANLFLYGRTAQEDTGEELPEGYIRAVLAGKKK